MRESLEQLKIVIELAPDLKRFAEAQEPEGQAFRDELKRYLDDLLADLALPAAIALDITGAEAGHEPAAYQVMIEGQLCRFPLPLNLPEEAKATELARSVAGAIHQNRELLVTRSLAKKIAEQWSAKNGQTPAAGLPEAGFHEFLRTLVRRGFRLERGQGPAQTLAAPAQSQWTAPACFEAAISALDLTTIKVFLKDGRPEKQAAADDQPLEEMFSLMQDGLFYELGLVLPQISLEADQDLAENEFRCQLNDLRFLPAAGLEPDQFLVNDTPDRLALLQISGQKAINPANGNECAIVKDTNGALEVCHEAGLTTWGPAGFLVLHLSAEIRRHAGHFINTNIVNAGLNLLGTSLPDLVQAALRRFDPATLTQILRDLLDEEISIRDLRGILESLLAINGVTDVDQGKYIVFFPNTGNICPVTPGKKVTELDITDYVNCVRMHFKRYISHKYTRGQGTLIVYLLDPEIETRIKALDQPPLTAEESRRLRAAILDEVGYLPVVGQNPVILTTIGVRKKLRTLIQKEFPGLAVLCYQELLPDMNIQPIARISWEGD